MLPPKQGFYHPTVVIILAGIIFSFALIFYLNTTYFFKKEQNALPSPAPIAKYTPTPSVDTKNWKTYKDTFDKFTFNYPENWDKFLVTENGQEILIVTPRENIDAAKNKTNIENPSLTIMVAKVAKDPNIDVESSWNVVSKKEIVLDSKSGTRFTRVYALDSDLTFYPGAKTEAVVVRLEDGFLLISLEDYKYLSTFDQILSTFKFLE